jgi:hypothetical protein
MNLRLVLFNLRGQAGIDDGLTEDEHSGRRNHHARDCSSGPVI